MRDPQSFDAFYAATLRRLVCQLFPLTLAPRRPSSLAAYVYGHLAVVNVVTGQVTPLPYPIYDGLLAPVSVAQVAW